VLHGPRLPLRRRRPTGGVKGCWLGWQPRLVRVGLLCVGREVVHVH
jgi:hypothetical protein